MRRILGLIGAAVILAAGSLSASAADIALKAPPPLPVVYTWSGVYVGVNGGYGWGVNTGYGTSYAPGGVPFGFGTAAPTGNVERASGGFVGGTAGYNVQTGSFLWGVEADLQWSGIKGSGSVIDPCCNPPPFVPPSGLYTASQNLNWFGTARGRVGWLATPNLLLFGTGGAFFGEERLASNVVFPLTAYPGFNNTTRVGWTAGAGFEYMFARNWSAKLEGLYYDMGTISSSFTCPAAAVTCTPGFGEQGTFALRGGIVRAGVNWHFSPGPVVAKY